MSTSIFSSFDALKAGFYWAPAKEGKVDASSKGAPSPTIRENLKKDKVGNPTEPPPAAAAADVNKSHHQRLHRRPRFALELDGVHCFETIVPY